MPPVLSEIGVRMGRWGIFGDQRGVTAVEYALIASMLVVVIAAAFPMVSAVAGTFFTLAAATMPSSGS